MKTKQSKKAVKKVKKRSTAAQSAVPIRPGEVLLRAEPIECNAGKAAIEIQVANRGDRPIQVGSHYHFFEVNAALSFERERAYGMRLDIAAGTAVRFEPGQKKKISLVPLGGSREVWGLRGLVNGALAR